MSRVHVQPTGRERKFRDDQIIVSKTDTKGIITYANQVFLEVSGYTEAELLGAPHNIIRHPDMPRCVFQFLWNTIQSKQEIFAYVVNLSKNGDHYWVFAHVTPSFDERGEIIAYHSSRRTANPKAVNVVKRLYADLVRCEQSQKDPRLAIQAGQKMLLDTIAKSGKSYGEFVFSLADPPSVQRTPTRAHDRIHASLQR